MRSVWVVAAIAVLAALVFDIYVAVVYLPYNSKKRTHDTDKHNPPFPDDLGVEKVELRYGPAWNELGKEEYHVYGLRVSGSTCAVEPPTEAQYAAIRASYIAEDGLEACTSDLANKTVVLAKWRGNSARPPHRVSFKMKLYYCKPGDWEWKKKKDLCVGNSSGSDTHKWTLRIDSTDFVGGLRDFLAIDVHRHLNGRDNMYGAPVAVRVNDAYLGSMLFATSPDDKILPSSAFDDNRDFFIKFDGRGDQVGGGRYEENGWGEIIGADVFVKCPDPDDYPAAAAGTRPAELRSLLDAFHNGTASYDYDSFAGRLLMEILAPQRDWDRSAYFYTIDSTWYAGPVWDSASFGGAYQTCDSRPLTETEGWNPTTMTLYEAILRNESFVEHTINVWQTKNLTSWLTNTYLPSFNSKYEKLAPYDWSIWRDVYRFTCNPYVFMPGNAYRDYGGWPQYTVDGKTHTSYGDWLVRRSQWLDKNIDQLRSYKDAPEQRQRWWGVIFFSFIILSLVLIFGAITLGYVYFHTKSGATVPVEANFLLLS